MGRDSAIGLALASGVELDLLKAASNATRLPAEAPDTVLRKFLEELRAAAAAYRGEIL